MDDETETTLVKKIDSQNNPNKSVNCMNHSSSYYRKEAEVYYHGEASVGPEV